jgi:hypothetical protein
MGPISSAPATRRHYSVRQPSNMPASAEADQRAGSARNDQPPTPPIASAASCQQTSLTF